MNRLPKGRGDAYIIELEDKVATYANKIKEELESIRAEYAVAVEKDATASVIGIVNRRIKELK